MNPNIENFGEFVEETVEIFPQIIVSKLCLAPYNKIIEFILFDLLGTLLMLDNRL